MNLARLAALVCVMAPVSALAQTSEEAAAYAFFGLGDGAVLSRGKTSMSWKETKTAPATFEGDINVGGRKGTLRLIVHSVDKCHYEVTIEGPGDFVPGGSRLYGRVSMSEITGVRLSGDGRKTEVTGSGFCATNPVNPACVSIDQSDLFGAVDPDKLKTAFDLLADTCQKP